MPVANRPGKQPLKETHEIKKRGLSLILTQPPPL